MSSGRIVQIIGAVIDVEFPRDSVPKVYDALTVDTKGTTLEVQQQLGDGVAHVPLALEQRALWPLNLWLRAPRWGCRWCGSATTPQNRPERPGRGSPPPA